MPEIASQSCKFKQLCQSFRTTVGWNAPVLIDQEGGRVQRLVPPEWTVYPPAGKFGTIYEKNPTIAMRATNLGARLIAYDLNEVGITINCIPTLDIQVEGASDVIGDRSFSNDTNIIEILAKELYNGLLFGGILPVIKHLPGHGRSLVDSHLELPVVHANIDELQADFKPFKAFKKRPLWDFCAYYLFCIGSSKSGDNFSNYYFKNYQRENWIYRLSDDR